MPNREITVTMPSIQPLGWRAASLPRGMPRPTAKIIAPIVSSTVPGKRTRNVVATWRPSTKLAPKSPWSRRPM